MPSANITIRKASQTDGDTIVGFQQSMAKETEGKTLDPSTLASGVEAVMDDPKKGYYLVAECQGVLVGGLLVTYEWSDWRNGTFWWIQSVYVEANWRRRGVYKTMHNSIVDTARNTEGVCGVRLYVEHDNHVAQNTYSSLGMSKSHYDMFEIDFIL